MKDKIHSFIIGVRNKIFAELRKLIPLLCTLFYTTT